MAVTILVTNKKMKTFRAEIIDEETDATIAVVSSYTEEGLEEEMGKRKWVVPATKAKEDNTKEVNQ